MKEIDLNKWENYRSSKKIMHIKRFKEVDVSWDSLIDLMNKSLSEDSDILSTMNKNYSEPKYIYKNRVASIIGTIGYVQFVPKLPLLLNQIDYAIKTIDNIFRQNKQRDAVQLFCNLVATEYISEIHADAWDAVAFQLKGTTIWDIFTEDGQDILESVSLEEGDLMLVPANAIHRVTSNSSRATLNFRIERDEND
jgi:mannose-6-phosphate isomerase-like protein (cupin superfamily)